MCVTAGNSGFGVSNPFGSPSASASAFGGAPSFGSTPAFGGVPAFGGSPQGGLSATPSTGYVLFAFVLVCCCFLAPLNNPVTLP